MKGIFVVKCGLPLSTAHWTLCPIYARPAERVATRDEAKIDKVIKCIKLIVILRQSTQWVAGTLQNTAGRIWPHIAFL